PGVHGADHGDVREGLRGTDDHTRCAAGQGVRCPCRHHAAGADRGELRGPRRGIIAARAGVPASDASGSVMRDVPVGERQSVTWLQPVRWATAAILWTLALIVWSFPALDLPLRSIGALVVLGAACRTGVLLLPHGRPAGVPLLGTAFVADVMLLTGLLDITGGPFNPFAVMYAAYVWTAAVTVAPAWAAAVGLVSVAGFGWLIVDHVPTGLVEHHRLSDLPTHLFTMWFAGAGVGELVAHYVARARAAMAEQQAQIDE